MKLSDLKGQDPEICLCNHITRSTIEEAIRNGADTLPKVRDAVLAGKACGGCGELILELIDLVKAEQK